MGGTPTAARAHPEQPSVAVQLPRVAVWVVLGVDRVGEADQRVIERFVDPPAVPFRVVQPDEGAQSALAIELSVVDQRPT